jgi:hypothetical protein
MELKSKRHTKRRFNPDEINRVYFQSNNPDTPAVEFFMKQKGGSIEIEILYSANEKIYFPELFGTIFQREENYIIRFEPGKEITASLINFIYVYLREMEYKKVNLN